MKQKRVQFICKVAMLSSVATLLMLFQVGLPFIPPFYQLDLSEVVVLLCGFALGPFAAVACEALKILLNFLLNGTTTFGVGELANFIMGCAFVVPTTLLYHKHKTKIYAFKGLLLGTLCLCIVGALLNYAVLLPAYSYFLGIPMEGLIDIGRTLNPHIDSLFTLVVWAVVPFNIIKGALTSVVVLLIYKKISPLVKRIY